MVCRVETVVGQGSVAGRWRHRSDRVRLCENSKAASLSSDDDHGDASHAER